MNPFNLSPPLSAWTQAYFLNELSREFRIALNAKHSKLRQQQWRRREAYDRRKDAAGKTGTAPTYEPPWMISSEGWHPGDRKWYPSEFRMK